MSRFFPHSGSSSIILYWVRSFFFQHPPFLKVPLFPLLLQLLPTPATFFFPSWKTSLAVSFFFFSFLQITTFCLLLPLITNAVWKFAPLSFPRYGFCSQSCNDFPLLKVPCFPLCFPIIYCYCAQIVPAWPYISACQISLDLSHLTFPPQFCNLITHLFATGCTNSCCLFTVKIFNTIRILLWLDTTVPSRVI